MHLKQTDAFLSSFDALAIELIGEVDDRSRLDRFGVAAQTFADIAVGLQDQNFDLGTGIALASTLAPVLRLVP